MAASAKSEKLGLSLWEPGDKPARMDFVGDNQQLETLVGGHLTDMGTHLSTAERDYLNRPVWTYEYKGDGRSERSFAGSILDPIPDFILVTCHLRPPVSYDRVNNRQDVYWDYWMKPQKFAGEVDHYGGYGIRLDAEKKILFLYQEKGYMNNMYRLNGTGLYYQVHFFHTPPQLIGS